RSALRSLLPAFVEISRERLLPRPRLWESQSLILLGCQHAVARPPCLRPEFLTRDRRQVCPYARQLEDRPGELVPAARAATRQVIQPVVAGLDQGCRGG